MIAFMSSGTHIRSPRPPLLSSHDDHEQANLPGHTYTLAMRALACIRLQQATNKVSSIYLYINLVILKLIF